MRRTSGRINAWYTAFITSSIELLLLHACATPSALRSTRPSLLTNGALTRVRNRSSGGFSGYDSPHTIDNSSTRMSNVVPAGPRIVPVQLMNSSSSSASSLRKEIARSVVSRRVFAWMISVEIRESNQSTKRRIGSTARYPDRHRHRRRRPRPRVVASRRASPHAPASASPYERYGGNPAPPFSPFSSSLSTLNALGTTTSSPLEPNIVSLTGYPLPARA